MQNQSSLKYQCCYDAILLEFPFSTVYWEMKVDAVWQGEGGNMSVCEWEGGGMGEGVVIFST